MYNDDYGYYNYGSNNYKKNKGKGKNYIYFFSKKSWLCGVFIQYQFHQ